MKKITKELANILNKEAKNNDCRGFFEALEFYVYDTGNGEYEMSGVHTDGGVEMRVIISKYDNWKESFRDYYDGFDIDEEIELYRQGPNGDYRKSFTISQSVEDFKSWKDYIGLLVDIIDADGNYELIPREHNQVKHILMFDKEHYSLDELNKLDDYELINLSYQDPNNIRMFRVDEYCHFVNVHNQLANNYYIKPIV